MKEFKGRVAVVTGAASGIGRGMAATFVAAGMKVVLSDIEAPALEETTGALRAAGADVHAVRTDVSKPEQVREMSADELRSKERELQEQLFRLRFQKSIGQLDDAGKIRDTRRDIARVKTVIRQRDIERARTQGAEAKR